MQISRCCLFLVCLSVVHVVATETDKTQLGKTVLQNSKGCLELNQYFLKPSHHSKPRRKLPLVQVMERMLSRALASQKINSKINTKDSAPLNAVSKTAQFLKLMRPTLMVNEPSNKVIPIYPLPSPPSPTKPSKHRKLQHFPHQKISNLPLDLMKDDNSEVMLYEDYPDFYTDFENFLPGGHDTYKRRHPDYGYMRFGKSVFHPDYGHMRYGRDVRKQQIVENDGETNEEDI